MTEVHINTGGCEEPMTPACLEAVGQMAQAAVAYVDLVQGFEAVDRLNRWAKSHSFADQTFTGVREHIYELKRRAIERAHTERAAEHHPTHVVVGCHSCGGAGRFYDYQRVRVSGAWTSVGVDRGACRRCAGAGKVRLDFVVTSFAPDPARPEHRLVWHTPSHLFSLRSETLGDAVDSGEWRPTKSGDVLSVPQAAELLMAADAAFPIKECRCYRRDCCRKHYGLFIGRSITRCSGCGCSEGLQNCRARAGRVSYTRAFCAGCREAMGANVFHFPPPPELMKGRVLRWIEANNALAGEVGA